MGLFTWKKNENNNIRIEEKEYTLYSITNGKTVPLDQVSDEMFSQKIMGDGIAFESEDGEIYAPCSGVVSTVMDTGHAVAITSKEGAELLIHIGFDTVKEGGNGFTAYISTGDVVKAGDKIISFDKKKLEKKGYDLAIPMIITNGEMYKDLTFLCKETVRAGEAVITYSLAD